MAPRKRRRSSVTVRALVNSSWSPPSFSRANFRRHSSKYNETLSDNTPLSDKYNENLSDRDTPLSSSCSIPVLPAQHGEDGSERKIENRLQQGGEQQETDNLGN